MHWFTTMVRQVELDHSASVNLATTIRRPATKIVVIILQQSLNGQEIYR